jgi:hypothetical protein
MDNKRQQVKLGAKNRIYSSNIIRMPYFVRKAYYVPAIFFVLPSVSFELNILASPKSEILGFISLSKRMLLALRSLCMTRNRECLCRYNSPLAMPSIMVSRLSHFSKALLASSA